jgi:hypothetical protein
LSGAIESFLSSFYHTSPDLDLRILSGEYESEKESLLISERDVILRVVSILILASDSCSFPIREDEYKWYSLGTSFALLHLDTIYLT